MAKPETTKCPKCAEVIEIDSYAEVGELIFCPSCEAELTIVKLHPPRLKKVPASELGEEEEEEGEEDELLEGFVDDDIDTDKEEEY